MSGKNLMIEARYAEEDLTRLPALAAELVSLAATSPERLVKALN